LGLSFLAQISNSGAEPRGLGTTLVWKSSVSLRGCSPVEGWQLFILSFPAHIAHSAADRALGAGLHVGKGCRPRRCSRLKHGSSSHCRFAHTSRFPMPSRRSGTAVRAEKVRHARHLSGGEVAPATGIVVCRAHWVLRCLPGRSGTAVRPKKVRHAGHLLGGPVATATGCRFGCTLKRGHQVLSGSCSGIVVSRVHSTWHRLGAPCTLP
jgi:hypothetical protein